MTKHRLLKGCIMRALVLSVLVGLGMSSVSQASTFGCESVAGSVIFKDTLYGILTGTVLSGLYILNKEKDDRDNVSEDVIRAAAIGGFLGLGLGVTEVALRECPSVRLGEEKGLSTSFAALPTPTGELSPGWRLSWRF
jgi:hypothetical protein